MCGEDSEDGGGGLPARAVVALVAALYAAALFLGALDGGEPAAPSGPAGLGGAAPRLATADRGEAALQPGARLCFNGPGGELFEFPASARRGPPLVADAAGAAARRRQ